MAEEIDDEYDDEDEYEDTPLESGTYSSDSNISRMILAWLITESWEWRNEL